MVGDSGGCRLSRVREEALEFAPEMRPHHVDRVGKSALPDSKQEHSTLNTTTHQFAPLLTRQERISRASAKDDVHTEYTPQRIHTSKTLAGSTSMKLARVNEHFNADPTRAQHSMSSSTP